MTNVIRSCVTLVRGYSKYAKFETTVSGKSCAAVDPIENEEDRKKVDKAAQN